MKNYLSLIAGAAVGFVVAYLWVSHQKEAEFKARLADAEANWQAEMDARNVQDPASKGSAAAARAALSPAVVRPAPTNEVTPRQILDALIALDPKQTETTRNQTLRRIIYELRRLGDFGPAALPVIKEFLARNQDVEYAVDDVGLTRRRGGRGALAGFGSARLDFLVPPSLRLGLMDVLREIRGDESESILAGVLATTGRGIEIAYLSRILEELAPGKYGDVIVAAAKELLITPPAIESPSPLDLNARAYLYEVLKMQGDTSFAQQAQNRLITPEGKIDRSTAGYLTTLLGDEALPIIYAAFKDERLASNHWEQSTLLTHVFNYVGAQDQANSMFAEMVVNEAVPANLRNFTILSLYGAHRASTPSDPEVIRGRIQLLEYLRRDVKDERLVRSLDEAQQNLYKLYEGQTAPRTPLVAPPTAAAPPPAGTAPSNN